MVVVVVMITVMLFMMIINIELLIRNTNPLNALFELADRQNDEMHI